MDNGKRDLNNGQETAAQNPQQVLPQGTGQNTGYPGAVPPEPVRKKKKKTRFWGGFFTGMLVTLLVVAGAACFFAWSFLNGRVSIAGAKKTTATTASVSNAAKAPVKLDYDRIVAKMKVIQKIIGSSYLFDENAENVEEGIYAGMMDGLGDPYSVYYTKKEFDDLNEDTNGTYSGIGAVLQQNPDTGICSIVRVFENSPAEKAGLQAGDILYKAGGAEFTSKVKLDVMVNTYLKGPEGSDVEITVLRGEKMEEVTVTVTRKKIDIPTVASKMLENNVGYIEVTQFDGVTDKQFRQAVDDLTAKGMKKLVIDLRNNGGGLVDSAVSMLDYMLPDGLLVYTADKNGVGEKFYSKDGHDVDIPTAILVNGNSASASEIFAGAYKDFKKAKLVGTKTFGKGIVQNVIPLGDGTALKITTQHYYTPDGYDLHKKGIEPDVKVELDKNVKAYGGSDDNQLSAAIKALE